MLIHKCSYLFSGERGEAIFKGRIRIPKHAQLTESAQLCRSIMLGENSHYSLCFL